MVVDTLPVYIRMETDHPEANSYLETAIEEEQDESIRADYQQFWEVLSKNPRGYDEQDLNESIRILLAALKDVDKRGQDSD